jgi:hypothetical protein
MTDQCPAGPLERRRAGDDVCAGHARPRRLAWVVVVVVRLACDAHQERDGALAPGDVLAVGRLLLLVGETDDLADLALVLDLTAAAAVLRVLRELRDEQVADGHPLDDIGLRTVLGPPEEWLLRARRCPRDDSAAGSRVHDDLVAVAPTDELVVVGHSGGGVVACEAVDRNFAHVSRGILLDGGAGVGLLTLGPKGEGTEVRGLWVAVAVG